MARDVSEQKCPSCETGRQSYMFDKREPFCPYIHLNKGNTCIMYAPLIKNEPTNLNNL